ncbi:hypothetical protein V5G24_05540 [Xanthobacter sp. VTT E-85241]|uniref:TY-Chap domain-containing protein n=1 Tax=Roseixanthobacter finlandensis TaxID=3119922 RepID=UPI0037268380
MRANVAKTLVRLVAACVWLAFLVPSAMAADGRAKFIAENHCQITHRLFMTYLQRQKLDRFVVASVKGGNQQYVQCLLLEDNKQMLCEAASGFYGVKKGEARDEVRMSNLAILEAAGFDTDSSEGNFQKLLVISQPTGDFDRVADLMLGLLYDIYGARRGDRLTYVAPMAMELFDGYKCPAVPKTP